MKTKLALINMSPEWIKFISLLWSAIFVAMVLHLN